MKDDQRNYVIVGVFVVAMLTGLILWISLLSGRTGPTDPYYVVYDNVGGLVAGTKILYEGYDVGLIEAVEPVVEDGRQRFRVDLGIRRGWAIPEDSVAKIYSESLLAGSVIQIYAGESETLLQPGDQIPSEEVVNVFDVVGDVADVVTDITENNLKPLMDGLNDQIPDIVTQIEAITNQMSDTLSRMNDVLKPDNRKRIEEILSNLADTSDYVASISRELSETQQRLDDVLVKVDAMLDSDEGVVGQAAEDLQHSLESVARHIDAINANLESATRNMDEFSRQVRENPGVLIRGRETNDDGAGGN